MDEHAEVMDPTAGGPQTAGSLTIRASPSSIPGREQLLGGRLGLGCLLLPTPQRLGGTRLLFFLHLGEG